ncbi:hypothetical protein Ocin01_18762, partial [Orchesella cincta]
MLTKVMAVELGPHTSLSTA